MDELEQLAMLKADACTPEAICSAVAKAFGVKTTEVALLEVSGTLLKFLHPAELRTTGVIPLSSSAVAARTARTRRAELFNSFTRVQHSSVFEVVPLGQGGADTEVIQKLMSAPILNDDNDVVGVIQICRKAHSPAKAGADFTLEDLNRLKSVAHAMSKLLSGNKS